VTVEAVTLKIVDLVQTEVHFRSDSIRPQFRFLPAPVVSNRLRRRERRQRKKLI
jgi:hypothetical protein